MNGGPRRLDPIPRAEALQLLGTVPFGRVAFTRRGQPAVRVVNHVVDGGAIIIRTSGWSDLASAASGGDVVAYEADQIDAQRQAGWSVVVRGPAQEVSGDDAVRWMERLSTWAPGPRDFVVRIDPVFVSGVRLAEANGD